MARLPIVDPDDPNVDPTAKTLLDAIRGGLSASATLPWTDINVYSSMANHPQALGALLQFGGVVYQANSLTPAQRELAYLGASVANDCHY
jgi:alkylhydroperoxidase family enzyme